nr:unnamed protein product [Spirometra erinaceieuropaei]
MGDMKTIIAADLRLMTKASATAIFPFLNSGNPASSSLPDSGTLRHTQNTTIVHAIDKGTIHNIGAPLAD